MAKTRILIVDDEEDQLEVCRETLEDIKGVEIILEPSSTKAADRLSSEVFDLLITDIRMPGLDGTEILSIAREHDSHLPVLVLTAFPTVDIAVQCMKLGAAEYLSKPVIPEDFLAHVTRLLEGKKLRDENTLLKRHLERSYTFDEMIGKSSAMENVFKTIEQFSATDVDVLIVGETGTGKELVARSIHQRSKRKEYPFVPVDCGAIPEHLLESEFFGHERGAYTGANTRSIGLLEFANHGTFFLDEIAELPLQLQAKLLRVLQERCFRRVGGTEEIRVDIRILAATNHDLEKEVKEKRFREDLFFRILVGKINLPAVRDRTGDIPLLIDHFVMRYTKEMDKETVQLDAEAKEVLVRYSWPGNVRELQNVVKIMVAMATTTVLDAHTIPEKIAAAVGNQPDEVQGTFAQLRNQQISAFEQEYVTTLLQDCAGDVSKAARQSKIPRVTLYRLLNKHKIDPEDFRK